MEIRTTKILLFPLPNITNELADLITIPKAPRFECKIFSQLDYTLLRNLLTTDRTQIKYGN